MPLLTTFAADGVSAYGFTRGGGAAGAYELISTSLVTTNPASVDFTSIVSTYKHLQIRFTAQISTGTSGSINMQLEFNANTSSVYQTHRLNGNGSTVASSATTLGNPNMLVYEALNRVGETNNFSSGIIDILDYSVTTKNKTIRILNGNNTSTESNINLSSGLFMSTDAITSIKLIATGNNFSIGSRFSLYGIKG